MRKILFMMCFLCSVGCYASMESDSTKVSASPTASQSQFKVVKDTIVNVQESNPIILVQRFFPRKSEGEHLYGEVDGDKDHGGMKPENLVSNFKKANPDLDSIVVAFSRGTTSLLICLDLETWKKANEEDTLAIYFPMEKKREPDFANLFCLKLVLCKAEMAEPETGRTPDSTSLGGEKDNDEKDNDWYLDINEYLHRQFPVVLLVLCVLLFSFYLRQHSIIKMRNRLEQNKLAKDEFERQLLEEIKEMLDMQVQRNSTSLNNYSKGISEIKTRIEELEKSVGLLKEGDAIVDKEEKVNLNTVPDHEMLKSEIIFDTTDVEYASGQFLVKADPNYRLFRIYSKDKMFFYSLADGKNSDIRHQILDFLNVVAGAVEVVNSVTSASEVRVSRPGELFKVDDSTFRIVKKMQVELV